MRVLDGTRHIPCEGAFNVRDLGGYAGLDGREVRWCTLYRADGLHRVPESLGIATDLGWRTVLDLRTSNEHEAGAYLGAGPEVVHLPMIRETWDRTEIAADTEPVAFLVDRYLEMLDEGAPTIASAIRILAAPTRLPAVFHCSAGKDRTGVLAAVVLSLIGVGDEDIARDYHLSSSAMAKLVEWVVASHPEHADTMTQQPAAILACPPEAMLEFLDRTRARYGSAVDYARSIGIDDVTIDALRALLLV
ncbi:MAG: protein-tyrosine phosphatase [Acidimicrobiaceae bacterium]|jgi:protein-tyrosine phosphatase|nr:protein-tyrosine phosphatase [Acidimicrobiaceae bacterium]